jgi:hypothetical protein
MIFFISDLHYKWKIYHAKNEIGGSTRDYIYLNTTLCVFAFMCKVTHHKCNQVSAHLDCSRKMIHN